jgi:hypothetical protein
MTMQSDDRRHSLASNLCVQFGLATVWQSSQLSLHHDTSGSVSLRAHRFWLEPGALNPMLFLRLE